MGKQNIISASLTREEFQMVEKLKFDLKISNNCQLVKFALRQLKLSSDVSK